jgi:Spy/CpxP family protein refolding chaperone
MGWWSRRRQPEVVCHPGGGCSAGGEGGWHHGRDHGRGHGHDGDGDGAFGVRRPLRFLSHKLDLNEKQAASLARVLDELKTERAQAAVDDRRTTSAFATAVEGGTFDESAAKAGAERRVESAQRLRDAVVKALGQIHALLDEEQRETFAYLIRTGILSI